MDAALAQLVGYGVGAAANAGVGALNYFSQQRTNRFNQNLVNQQNRWNLEQWNRENAYNSPINVMMRLRAAGLNPSLMYEGGAGQLSSAPSPDMQSSRDVAPQMTGMPTLSEFSNIGLALSQIRKTDAETHGIEVHADYEKGQIEVGKSVVLYNSALTNYTRKQQENIEADTRLLAKRLQEADANVLFIQQQTENLKQQQQLDFLKSCLDTQMAYATMEKIRAETHWTEEQTRCYVALTTAQIANLDSETALNFARKNLTDEQFSEVSAHAALLSTENKKLSFEFSKEQDYYDQDRELQVALTTSEIVKNCDDVLRAETQAGNVHDVKAKDKAKKVLKSVN